MPFGKRSTIDGMMSSPWTSILLYLLVLSSSSGYKLPLPDQSYLTAPNGREDYSSAPLVWEWETQDKSDKSLLTLIRIEREISDKKAPKSQPDVKYPKKTENVSKLPLEKSPEVTPHIVLASNPPYTKPQTMEYLSENETTPLSELDHTATEEGQLNGAEITEKDQSLTAEIKITATQIIFSSTQEQLTTPSPTKSKDLFVFTKNTAKESTTFGQIHSTNDQLLSSISESTSNAVVEETKTVVPSKIPNNNNTSSKPKVTLAHPTTHGETTVFIPDSKGPSAKGVPVTYISTTSDKMLTHSLMKQCMLSILILAVVCTIFIITTIALAAKLSTMRQKQKLRHPATYTEMRCISSLLPENDQQSKVKPKRLKTFATMEESDGDNTTLNSFLPDH